MLKQTPRSLERRRSPAGFSLAELLVVVATISALSAIAVPLFSRFAMNSKRTEAHLGLTALYRAELAFHQSEEYFTTSLAMLDVTLKAPASNHNMYCQEGSSVACGRYFAFWVSDSSVDTFLAVARGRPDPAAPYDEFVVHFPE